MRTVKAQGHFRWKQHDVFLSQALWGEPVGLLPIEDGIFTIYFAQVPLARFEERTGKIYRMPKYLRQTTPPSGSKQACSDPENKNLPNKNEKPVRYVPGLKCQVCPRPFTGDGG